jgi:hypothetical protein
MPVEGQPALEAAPLSNAVARSRPDPVGGRRFVDGLHEADALASSRLVIYWLMSTGLTMLITSTQLKPLPTM